MTIARPVVVETLLPCLVALDGEMEPMDMDQEDHHHSRGVPYPGNPHPPPGTPRPFATRAARALASHPDDPLPGTIIPDRIYVGGMDAKVR